MRAVRMLNVWGSARPPTSTHVAATAPPAAAVPAQRDRLVLVYIAVAILALLPGLANALQVLPETIPWVAPLAVALRDRLADIRFGSGLRFWLGVTGAMLLALLLLYPMRKVLFKSRMPGSVSRWFHIHILLGLIGPVLILYHANFGHGGFNATVALYSMLAIAVSGIAGYFVYARVSRDFYVTNERARQYRKSLIEALPAHGDATAWKAALTAEMEAFEAYSLKPRQGVIASVRARIQLEQRRHSIGAMIARSLATYAHAHSLKPVQHRQLRAIAGEHARAYFALVQSSLSQSIREQLWARWRLFHMPLFVIMVGATILHVVAVWGMDAPSVRTAVNGATLIRPVLVPKGDPIGDLLSRSAPTPDSDRGSPPQTQAADVGPKPLLGPPVLVKTPQIVITRPQAIQASRPPERSSLATPISRPRLPISASAFDEPPLSMATDEVEGSPSATDAVIASTYAELQKRATSQPLGLGLGAGQALPTKLEDQIVFMKSLMTTGQFSHSESQTGFALTGKHKNADCSSCHKTPLRAIARETAPRQCLTCHSADDIHKRRRPECANCHTTNRWTQILKRQ